MLVSHLLRLAQDKIENQRKVNHVVDTVVERIGESGDGRVMPDEFEVAVGFKVILTRRILITPKTSSTSESHTTSESRLNMRLSIKESLSRACVHTKKNHDAVVSAQAQDYAKCAKAGSSRQVQWR